MQAKLQQALEALTGIDEEDLRDLTIGDTVTLGQLLWDIGNAARRLLLPIKRRLQYEAASIRGNQPGPVHFNGKGGARCIVRITPTHIGGRPRVSFD
jgi:hypothetical protein